MSQGSQLPDYVASAKPVPQSARGPWYANVAPTYAGIMLWFVFWQFLIGTGTPGGVLAAGLPAALLGLVVAALICHFLFYLVPGLLGMRTGYPLYIVGTSTYGVDGGLFMPGFLMGILQFGWVAVNSSAVAYLLVQCINPELTPEQIIPSAMHTGLAICFAVAVGFVGLKGIQYVAKVATYVPIIPLVVLVMLLAKTIGGLGSFKPEQVISPTTAVAATAAAPVDEATPIVDEAAPVDTMAPVDEAASAVVEDGPQGAEGEPGAAGAAAAAALPLTFLGVIFAISVYVVGFFATAGAAGVDIASSSRDEKDVQMGGLVGIALATIVAGGGAILVVAGAYGSAIPGISGLNPVQMLNTLYGPNVTRIVMILLALSSFPAGCFSAFIAANSFKTTLPKVPPAASVGVGIVVAIILAATGIADQALAVFGVIGASFGPVCGAMMADYLKSGQKWAGPRAGFNPAGWVSWVIGFFVGGYDLVMSKLVENHAAIIPCPPVAAFVVGFVLYYALASAGFESKKLDMPAAE